MSTDNLYLDQMKKINYYKQKIVDDYLKEGKIIDKVALEAKLEQIDTKLAVFSQSFIKNGETLDVESFNEQKNSLYQDLCILYEVLYELTRDRLSRLEHRIDCELAALNEKAKRYQSRTKLETLAIYGDSIFYDTNNFDQTYENGRVYIDLGPISVPSGSYLACICDAAGADSSNIIFKFDDKLSVSDYLYGKKYLKVLGNYTINTKSFNVEENMSNGFKIDYAANKNNSYNLFAGEGKIKVYHYDSMRTEYVDKIANVPFVANDACEISFYTYGAGRIEFNTSGKATYSSFNDHVIESPKYRQKVLITCEEGYTLDFVTDGKVFAEKVACITTENAICSPKGFSGINDFLLEEIAYGEDVHFKNVVIEIKNATSTFEDINYVAVKQVQLSELESGFAQ